MLTLILVRHGQADNNAESDHLRTLTNKGRLQAIATANQLIARQLIPDVILHSDATRTTETARLIAGEMNVSRLVPSPMLYDSYTTDQVLALLAATDDKTLMVVGHNPDISVRACQLVASMGDYLFPTAGCLAMTFDADSWTMVGARSGVVVFSNI